MSIGTAAVKYPDMFRRPAYFVTFRVFTGFNRNGIIPGIEITVKYRTVRRGIRIPAIPVPHILRIKSTMICDNRVRIYHMYIPACAIPQCHPGQNNILAVAHID